MNKSITIAGTTLVDNNNLIDNYPKKGMLANIIETQKHVGGCVPNTALCLRQISKKIPVDVLANVGQDVNGNYLINKLNNYHINTENIKQLNDVKTGFTDVMTIESTRERTFFSHSGANKYFSIDDEVINTLDTKMFHLGYIFLLELLEKENNTFGTDLAELLYKIQKKDIKTSIDLVSVNSKKNNKVTISALKYTNYFIANEIEAGMIVGIEPYSVGNKINKKNIKKILNRLLDLGVNDLAVIHAPEGGWAMDKQRNYYFKKSMNLPEGYIKGTVGAGDAFCAGMLYSLYKDLNLNAALEIANTSAAMSLGGVDSYSNVKCANEMEDFRRLYNQEKEK